MRLTALLTILLLSCNLDNKKSGLHKVSETIAESKKNNVFLYKLEPDKSIINIIKKQQDTIEEAWMEYSWRYQSNWGFSTVQKDSTQQIAIRFRRLPIYPDGYMMWVKQGIRYFGWTRVASESGNLDLSFYLVIKPYSSNNEEILDSFRLHK